MTETITLLDPTAESAPQLRGRLDRPESLEGRTVGLLDISKARGDVFLDEVARRLKAQGLMVRRYQKPTFARLSPTALNQQIAAECDVAIEALAD